MQFKRKQLDDDDDVDEGHPLQSLIITANASLTREHTRDYHRGLERFSTSKDVHAPLLAWYGSRGDLPWRSDLSDDQIAALSKSAKAQRAYQVWVSEIMLQQTQVATVIPYYKRWMDTFPTIFDLSKASLDSVNAVWKGLGYYSRASRMLQAAKTVMDRFDGQLPSDPGVLVKEIEGIGPYTAGAIASIAFGVRAATVDGNIQRVICRLLAIHADMKKKATDKYIWDVAKELVPNRRAGHWNQALMDLGATVCTPKNPKCGECPLANVCTARAEVVERKAQARAKLKGSSTHSAPSPKSQKQCDLCLPLDPPSIDREVTLYPLKTVKKKSRDEDIAVCVLECQLADDRESHVLLVKRPETGLLAGLDEFPSVVMPEDESTTAEGAAQTASLLCELLRLPDDFDTSASRDLGSIKHIYSHINATFRVHHLRFLADVLPLIKAKKGRCRWIAKNEVQHANISTGSAKIWSLVMSDKSAKASAGAKKRGAAKKEVPNGSQKISAFLKKQPVPHVEAHTAEDASNLAQHEEASEGTMSASPRKIRRIVIESDSDG